MKYHCLCFLLFFIIPLSITAAPAGSSIPIKTLPGFKVEKVYDVTKNGNGSWVGMTSDNKGRIITCDQYGGLYRLTMGKEVKAEKLNVKTGKAHGVLYAFGSLYVLVNHARNGLYRLQDTNGDDQFDKEEYIIPMTARGEHGVHSLVLSPDKKSIYLIAGNNTDIPKSCKKSRLANAWSEDHLLPRMADAKGHNRNRLAPGGFIMKVSPDGKSQELICHGFRNQYDAAFNSHGELFTYDSDLEYDLGSPWYRPTRVNHVVSGADYGWRHGTGKWPDYYTDTISPTLNIGLGCPTGITSGLNAKFPAKYQHAIFINDWTYGTMYAVHLKANGSTYKASREEFLSGKPLPLTDVIIHTNGHMYFLTGGRRTDSAMYKVSYTGNESVSKATALPISKDLKTRRAIEYYHENPLNNPNKVWPYLNHTDRYIRQAARVAIEKSPVETWKSNFAKETKTWAVIEGACALARMGEKNSQELIISKLNKLNFKNLDADQTLAALRSYQLAFTRLGKPVEQIRTSVINKLDTLFPDQSNNNFINRELAQLLLYLNAPKAVSRSVNLMLTSTEEYKKLMDSTILARNDRYSQAADRTEKFRPNAQQFFFAFSLRTIRDGWNDADRTSYFSWFPRAKTWQGGNSFAKFIENTRQGALDTVRDKAKRKVYEKLSGKVLRKPREINPPKGPGRVWDVNSAVKEVSKRLKNRNFKAGENLFHATGCASCHHFAGKGYDSIGPDLTTSANRYSLKNMLENIIEPSKDISDQYGSVEFHLKDGSKVIGRIGAEDSEAVNLMTNPFSSDSHVKLLKKDITNRKNYPVSPMPKGLVNSLNAEELSDLIAYMFSAGKKDHKYFIKEK